MLRPLLPMSMILTRRLLNFKFTEMFNAKERYNFYNNLVGLIGGLENEYTTIDLINEVCITGKVVKVDGFWNITMEDVHLYDSKGVEQSFETLYVKSRNIRHVHIPEYLNEGTLHKRQIAKISNPKDRRDNKRTFKKARAQKYHEKTVKEVFGQNK